VIHSFWIPRLAGKLDAIPGERADRFVAQALVDGGLGTLLFDLLTVEEERDRSNVFDVDLLATRLDNVVDLMDGTARRAQMFHLKDRREPAKELTQVLLRATEMIASAVKSLRDSHEVQRIGREIKLLEEEGDAIYSSAVGALFEGTPNALDVIKWKELYDNIEHAIDECEDVLNVLESVAIKNR